ncbi:MAG: 50S ribosomal protein L25 [Candidatus Pacebacteria bacterium]|nr:50S ribosomal protein L25 [Candidatus Paceibacterota bacterium]
MTTLHAEARISGSNTQALRTNGKIPAVIYGGGIKAPVHVSIDREAFKKAFSIVGESSVLTVTAPDGEHDCIIHDMQYDAVSHSVIHVDLLALEKGKKVEVAVEIEFVGTSPAVKSNLGVLEKMLHEIEIEAMPKDLPKSIEVDLESLAAVGDHIYARDIKLPSGVVLKTNEDEVIATITGAKEEKEEDSAPIDFSTIEVEQKGKKDEEGDGEAAEAESKE